MAGKAWHDSRNRKLEIHEGDGQGEGEMGRGEGEQTPEMVRSYKPLKPDPSPIRLHRLSMIQNLPQTGPPMGNHAFKYVSQILLVQTIALCVHRECERWERECGRLKGNHTQSEWHY